MEQSSLHLNDTACHVRHVSWSLPVVMCDHCAAPAPRVWDTQRYATGATTKRLQAAKRSAQQAATPP